MNRDIFGNRVEIGEDIITATNVRAVLSAGAGAWVGLLIQTLQASYQMPDSAVYELGSSRTYRRSGRAEGQMTIQKIVGLNSGLPVEQALFDVCQVGGTMSIVAEAADCQDPASPQSGGLLLTFGGLKANGYSFSADAMSQMVNEGITLRFTYLSRTAL